VCNKRNRSHTQQHDKNYNPPHPTLNNAQRWRDDGVYHHPNGLRYAIYRCIYIVGAHVLDGFDDCSSPARLKTQIELPRIPVGGTVCEQAELCYL